MPPSHPSYQTSLPHPGDYLSVPAYRHHQLRGHKQWRNGWEEVFHSFDKKSTGEIGVKKTLNCSLMPKTRKVPVVSSFF